MKTSVEWWGGPSHGMSDYSKRMRLLVYLRSWAGCGMLLFLDVSQGRPCGWKDADLLGRSIFRRQEQTWTNNQNQEVVKVESTRAAVLEYYQIGDRKGAERKKVSKK
jgi:hypothetical protein